MVTLFLVVFGNEVTKILRNSVFIFHFALPIVPWKGKHRTENRATYDEEPKKKLPKYVMSQASDNFERTFGILKFSQKLNERIRFYYKICSFVFFGRIRGHQKVLSKLSDL